MSSEIISLLMLAHAKGLGPLRSRQLIEQYGSPAKVIESGWEEKSKLLFKKWQMGNWERDLESVEKEGISLISYLDPLYPSQLRKLRDFPLVLYVKGSLPKEGNRMIALIGTRVATLYGMEQAQKLGYELAEAGIVVVSGLARGIDTAAHLGALKGGGETIGLIGSGLGNIYPSENKGLADKMAQAGAVITEYPMHTPPFKGAFPRRNRLISALSDALCLVESPLKGGGMITMEIGEEHQKPLFALPGRVDWPSFEGNHFLLKNKKATLVENSLDLLKSLNINKKNEKVKNTRCSATEEAFLTKLPPEEKSIEELVLLTQLPIMELNVLLTRLVLKKLVKEFPGKIYKKT